MARPVRRVRTMRQGATGLGLIESAPALASRKNWPSGPHWVSGIIAGLLAGVPQVALTQIEAWLLPAPRSDADIGPRFVKRVGEQLDTRMPPAQHWLLAAAFHFGYAAWWGVVYSVLQRWHPTQPHVGGPLLAALIYAMAFSPWGAATQTGTERPVESRPTRHTLLHWTAALSFSLTLAYLYAWRERWPRRGLASGRLRTDG